MPKFSKLLSKATGDEYSEDPNEASHLEHMSNSMSEKLLANPDIINGVISNMEKSDVMCSESDDFDTEFDEPDDLREFFNKNSVFVGPEHHIMPCCASCGKQMDLVEGDIIYGEHWYHGNCWKTVQLQTLKQF